MVRHLNRLYCLGYLAVIYTIFAVLVSFFDVAWDNALIAGVGLVGFVLIGAHATFHIGAFSLAHSVRRLPQVKDKALPFHTLEALEVEPLTLAEWVKAVAMETFYTFKLNTFHQPWARNLEGIHLAEREWRTHKPLPVLLVHGYLCNAGIWVSTREKLDHLHISNHAITLEPAIGSIKGYAIQIEQAIDELLKATGAPQVNVICHSMGGVAIRYYAREKGHDKIAQVMTLGSPHYGTALSLLGIGKNVKQMMWGSFFLRQLQNDPTDLEFQKKITSVWSPQDTIVSPPQSSKLEFSKNLMVRGCGHVYRIHHPATETLMEEWLQANAEQ
ncbi:MAG: alpha/beta fold hydrolase, partial [Limnobacter sp.]|nr:alpha/beta fold hydrolase [Limnobacter sp.]